jgi:hypothetical protein
MQKKHFPDRTFKQVSRRYLKLMERKKTGTGKGGTKRTKNGGDGDNKQKGGDRKHAAKRQKTSGGAAMVEEVDSDDSSGIGEDGYDNPESLQRIQPRALENFEVERGREICKFVSGNIEVWWSNSISAFLAKALPQFPPIKHNAMADNIPDVSASAGGDAADQEPTHFRVERQED